MTTLSAPAKLTTKLEVRGVRNDGFHLLSAEMVSLDLSDSLEIEPAPAVSLEVVEAVDWVGVAPSEPAAETARPNLVEEALRHCGQVARCRLTKRIPAGAGLGGGSSDAAAILRWSGVADPKEAAALGADVPFCLRGGRAHVTGIGEEIEQLEPLERSFVLLTPRLHVSTPVVYRAWDALGGPAGEHGNDLEPAALVAYPALRWWRDLMAAASAERPRLAGSGGTWFIECNVEKGRDLADDLRAEVVAGREGAFVKVARTRELPLA